MEDRLYNKFNVSRKDGRDEPGGDRTNAEYFTLDYANDPFALPALRAYAVACRPTLPGLANDLEAIAGTALDIPLGPVVNLENILPGQLFVHETGEVMVRTNSEVYGSHLVKCVRSCDGSSVRLNPKDGARRVIVGTPSYDRA